MATAQLGNPLGSAGGTAVSDNLDVAHLVNASGGTVAVGDVVIASGVAGTDFTTTTSAKHKKALGVVGEPTPGAPGAATSATSYASGAVVPIVTRGVARINIGSNTIADAAILGTSTTVKVADTAGSPLPGDVIAIALETQAAKDANNTIRAYIGKL